MSTGTVFLWMTSAQCLQVKKYSLIQELVEVYLLLIFFWKFLKLSILQVPVVLIFTNFDSLVEKCYQKLRLQGKNHQEAQAAKGELANKTFQDEYLSRVLDTAFPPKAYTCLAGNILFSDRLLNFDKFQKWTRKKINVRNYPKKLWIFLTMMFWSTCLFQHSRTILICVSKRVLSKYFVLLLKYPHWTSTERFGELVGDYYI